MKLMILLLAALTLVAPATIAETYQCDEQAGCSARINRDGTLEEIVFRKGDMVGTEAGWIVSPDDGWRKVKAKASAMPQLPNIIPVFPHAPIILPATGGGEVPSGSVWTGGGETVRVNITANPTMNTVTVSFTGPGGTTTGVPGTPGPTSTSSAPTCSHSDVVGGKRVGPDGKVQKWNGSAWVNMRRITEKPGKPSQ
jgi:hypothetical protein